MMDSTSEVTSSSIEEGEEVEEEKGTTVEIDGEEFEMLVEQSTQIIEPEEKSYEEQAEEAEDIEEIEIINDIEDIEEIIEEGEFEDVGEVEEIEEIVELVEVVEEVELDKSLQDVESEELEQPSTPTLLEPSPILIEPEHEPAEPSLGQDQELVVPPPESKGPKYDIELVNVGKNRGRILHILSKIEGLSKSPQELVDAVPSIIVRGAKEQDAKNFQVVMQKLGSNVRLIRK
jgi:hypothetical protein